MDLQLRIGNHFVFSFVFLRHAMAWLAGKRVRDRERDLDLISWSELI
jgi:hypothetical protein